MRGTFLSLLVVAACGYPPLAANPDGNPGVDSSGPRDGGSGSDGSNGSGNGACQVLSTYGNAAASAQMAWFYPAQGQDVDQYQYFGQITNDSPADFLEVDLFATYAPFGNTITAPATITLTNDWSNCGGCVGIDANCPNCFAQNSVPGSYYLANSGTLSVTSVGANMVGTLSNATFVHVTSPDNMTVVNDGCTTTITSISFSAPVQQ